MTRYKILIDDNFHYMDEDERLEDSAGATFEDAVARCEQLVDAELQSMLKPRMTAIELFELFTSIGSDPFIVAVDPTDECLRSRHGITRKRAALS